MATSSGSVMSMVGFGKPLSPYRAAYGGDDCSHLGVLIDATPSDLQVANADCASTRAAPFSFNSLLFDLSGILSAIVHIPWRCTSMGGPPASG